MIKSLDFSLDFPFAFGGPLGNADFRTEPEDFVVDEELGFEPCGEGEHLFLHIRKRNQNTRWVAEQLASLAGIQPVDVGFSGMKDRRAVTSQWFSLYLPKRELDLQAVASIDGVTLLGSGRHNRKLRRGEHEANRFVIRLRNCTASQAVLESRLVQIAEAGVPNYFGEQRFGRNGNNLPEFERLFVSRDENARGDSRAGSRKGARRGKGQAKGRGKRQDTGIYLSAGRSYLFNRILATRVGQGCWDHPLTGEEQPSAALWGRGRVQACEAVIALESQVASTLPGWCDALEHSGLGQDRRLLVLRPELFEWQFEGEGALVLSFRLAPGYFATSVLRELTQLVTPELAHGIVCPSTSDQE